MDDDSKLGKLITQCKNNDVDVKIDAVTKLQLEFENGTEINDPDGLINVLKACLRTSNQLLTAATLSALPPLLPLLISPLNQSKGQPSTPISSSTSSSSPSSMVDAVTLRQVLNAFLPTGGVVDRLGDNRERTREKACETLVLLGGFAYRSGGTGSAASKSKEGKGQETPLMVFEKFMREGGLASKVWKAREQAILTLVRIRRAHHLFPIRPYLPQLVAALEDGDAHVRECARPSVIELFTGPGVTDAARADLKKEMTKKGVRKTIVDGVLSKLVLSLEDGDSASGPGTKSTPYVPPSLALQGSSGTSTTRTTNTASVKDISRPASRAAMTEPPTPLGDNTDVKPVYITSSRDMEAEFAAMVKPFEGRETEHNWMTREAAILRVRGMLKGDAHLRYSDTFLACLKDGYLQASLKPLASLRTTVASNTSSLYSELAVALGPSLDPFCDMLVTNLLRMAGFTKKIAAQQSQASVTSILTHTSAQPRICLPPLWNTLQEKTVQSRAFVVGHLKTYLEVHGKRSKQLIETSGGLQILEKSLRKSLTDPNPAVRESARVCFWVFEDVWHEQGTVLMESLDTLARKQLAKACPNPEAAVHLTVTAPKTARKSSVAAAITASRAKAKAIATAPPTLRHQATSSSQIARATSPSSPKSAMRSLSPVSRHSASPPSPRSRIVSNGGSRSVSTVAGTSTAPTSPSSPTRAESPPRAAPESPTIRRGASSPLATSRGVLPRSPPKTSAVARTSPSPRNSLGRTVAVPIPPPQPTTASRRNEESLLEPVMAMPEDSDSDESANILSFSAVFESQQPPPRKSNSPALSLSPRSDPIAGASNALSTGSAPEGPPPPVVEDALRARAEQAESAAERLLELVEPEEANPHHPSIPASLLVGSNALPLPPQPQPQPAPVLLTTPPMTPVNRNTAIMRQAAMFKDSPAYNGSSPSLLDALRDRKHETGWWLKRMKMIEQRTSVQVAEGMSQEQELSSYITALEQGQADIHILQRISLLCIENPAGELASPLLSPVFGPPSSPSPFLDSPRSLPSLRPELWTKDKNFERLFKALMKFLDPGKNEDEIEYGLIVLWEMLENQAPYIEGQEADIFSRLLTIRYCNKTNVLEATNTIRDALTTRIEPVYGITTMHASLRAFFVESPPDSCHTDVKAATYAFGLSALGKFILRLPSEILEEELPRMKTTLISALNDKSSLVVRESAAASIIAAQLVMKDETHLFMLLDGLADDKKNLLTYLFDKHGARGSTAFTDTSGWGKLQKEMRRLDTRTSTPPRAAAHGDALVST